MPFFSLFFMTILTMYRNSNILNNPSNSTSSVTPRIKGPKGHLRGRIIRKRSSSRAIARERKRRELRVCKSFRCADSQRLRGPILISFDWFLIRPTNGKAPVESSSIPALYVCSEAIPVALIRLLFLDDARALSTCRWWKLMRSVPLRWATIESAQRGLWFATGFVIVGKICDWAIIDTIINCQLSVVNYQLSSVHC